MDSNITNLNNQLLQLKLKNRAGFFNNSEVMENLLKCFCRRKLEKDSASRKNSKSNQGEQDQCFNSGLEKRRSNTATNNRRFDDLAEEEEEEEMINLTITQSNPNDGEKKSKEGNYITVFFSF